MIWWCHIQFLICIIRNLLTFFTHLKLFILFPPDRYVGGIWRWCIRFLICIIRNLLTFFTRLKLLIFFPLTDMWGIWRWCIPFLICMIRKFLTFFTRLKLSFLFLLPDMWGFDDAAVNALQNMKPVGMPELVKKYAVLLNEDSELLADNGLHQTGMMDNQVIIIIKLHL